MTNKEALLEQGFELTEEDNESAAVVNAPVKEKSADTLPASMSLLRRIPVTLTLEVASVDVMLADLLNMDDDTVIELDKLAGEPLDIKVNNILLGTAEVVVINEKYGLRVLEFNSRDINELTR
ncbi:FliM/FliN family flagellar motor switch protein [Enterobacteriaceae bacterium]